MDLRTLRAFVEVARLGGFSQAAKALFASQPTVSKAVRQLEDEFGDPLLERLGHGVRLTDAGEVVYRRALAMLAEGEHLVDELAELRGLKRGKLRLGLPPLGSSILFAPLFAEFRNRYPGIEIELLERGSVRLEQAVLSGELELAVSLLPVPESFEWQAVRNEPLVALLPAGHPLGNRSSVTLRELADSPIILFESGFALNPMIESAFRKRGLALHVAARSSQTDFLIALVATGLGVALLPRLMVEQRSLPSIGTALLDEEDLRWHAALIWRKGGILSPTAKAWLALTGESFRERVAPAP